MVTPSTAMPEPRQGSSTSARRGQRLQVDQFGHQHHRREILGQLEHTAGLVDELGRRGRHDLDDAHDDGCRIQQEAHVVVAALDTTQRGWMLDSDRRQLRRYPGVHLGRLDEHGLVGRASTSTSTAGEKSGPVSSSATSTRACAPSWRATMYRVRR